MSNLTRFEFRNNSVRLITIDGDPWFVAKDLCDVLEIKNPSQALSRLDEDEKRNLPYDVVVTLNDDPDTTRLSAISESGMYALVLSSRKPEAKPFRKWVTSEVLPAIRKTGKYETQKPKVLPTVEKMAIASDFIKTLKEIGYELDNPRFAQGIRDLVGDAVGLGQQPALPQSQDIWLGVAERAEELGYAPSLVVKYRSQLGKWVKSHGLTFKQEKRLCNGTQRLINLYLLSDELDGLIEEFMAAKLPQVL